MMLFTHSVLEAAICEAKLDDAMKPRYGKAGPARQGQAGHRLAELYLSHLHKTGRDTDFEEGLRIWNGLRGQLSASDEVAVEAAAKALVTENSYPWVAAAEDFKAERVTFRTLEHQEVDAERVALLDAPVFRSTVDLAWRGFGPLPGPGAGRNVLDWKFHWNIEHVDSPENNRQLLRYAAAVWGWDEPVTAWLGFPRLHYFEHTVFSEEQLRDAWETLVVGPIRLQVERVGRRTSLDRTVGAHCRTCDLRVGCDAAMRYPFEAPWVASSTADERLTALVLAKSLVADLSDLVKADVALSGGQVISGGDHATMSESESLSFDEAQVKAALPFPVEDHEIRTMFKATKTTLEKWLTKRKVKPAERAAIIDRLRQVGERRLTSTLRTGMVAKERAAGDAPVE